MKSDLVDIACFVRMETPRAFLINDGHREVWVPNIIDGWSIRFVEAAIQAMGNAEAGSVSIYEDDKKKIVRCEVWDFERNISWPHEITIEKTVERSKLKKNQVPIYARKNSYGEPVYILPATDDETRLKENRIVSMTLRTLGLRIVPGDILDEAKERVEATRAKVLEAEKAGIVADPTKARKDLLDRLAKIGIRAADVVEYFGGRAVEAMTPDMILELRIVGAGVSSGDLAWRDALSGSPYRDQPEGTAEKTEDDAGRMAREKIEAKMAETKAKKASKDAKDGTPAVAPVAATEAPPPVPAASATPPADPSPTARQPGED